MFCPWYRRVCITLVVLGLKILIRCRAYDNGLLQVYETTGYQQVLHSDEQHVTSDSSSLLV